MLRVCFVIGLVASFASVAFTQETAAPNEVASGSVGPNYHIEIQVLEGKGLINEAMRDHHRSPEPSPLHPQPVSSEQAANSDAPQAPAPPAATDDVKDAETIAREEPEDLTRLPGVTVLAAPKLAVTAEKAVMVQIGTEQVFSYLVPVRESGGESAKPKTYEVKQSPSHELGLTITLEVEPIDGDDRFVDLSRFEAKVSSLDGREPVEGIEDLDVGRPIVAKRSLQTTAKIRLGETRVIPIPSGPNTQAVVLLRINPSK
jgi:hypothetical protein